MTEPTPDCVRGCVRPCPCRECLGQDNPPHPPIASPADFGLLCRRDWSRLWAWLSEIVELYATLDVRLKNSGDRDGSSHQKVSGSPALVDLSVVALMDPRTDPAGYMVNGVRVSNPGPPHIPSIVGSWARMVCEEKDLDLPYGTLSEAVSVLTTWFEWICQQPWVDELWAEIKDVRGLLGRAHGEKRPQKVGRCLTVHEVDGVMVECDRALYLPAGGQRLRCGRCGRVYDGASMLRLKLMENLKSSA